MDPITLLIIGAGGAAAAGVAASVGPIWRQVKLRRSRELIMRPIIGADSADGGPRSVYDVFCDLGANEYGIEVMRHMDLIPEKEEDLELVTHNLKEAIESFGGYGLMIESLRETIGELSSDENEDHESILNRRLTLSAPRETDALLPAVGRPSTAQLPEGEEVKQLEATAGPSNYPASGDRRSSIPDSSGEPRIHATVDDALADFFGSDRSPHAGSLEGGAGGVAAIVVGGVLGSLTSGGSFWEGVSRFVHKRRVKQMRAKLNSELSGLSLDLFHAQPQVASQVDRNLENLVQEKRWAVEKRRREAARHSQLPRKQRSSTQHALKLLASQKARTSLSDAERDLKKLKAQITRHRRSGRHDLAGFLIYVNREDMLKGIDDFSQRIQAIEDAGELLRQALLAETAEAGVSAPNGEHSPPGPGQPPPGPGQPPPGPGQPLS